jgi:hypothetical protein
LKEKPNCEPRNGRENQGLEKKIKTVGDREREGFTEEEEDERERESGKIYRSQLWRLTELEFAEWPFTVVGRTL